ncbi:hypothetical protein JCGZ_18677 [Jatropha curcas]|uniref:t-SNARE coiled-coil homology domain-containing protein n=1 Tax=Jatropha curcas TaxID=180498 RepID=A0A067K0W2_JATCU|nr:hypothetical protein JCGZ_18677 [Jatropha curcas]
MANPYRSREGLSARTVGNSDEVQVRIDPVHADLDEEILGLHKQVSQLKNVCVELLACLLMGVLSLDLGQNR